MLMFNLSSGLVQSALSVLIKLTSGLLGYMLFVILSNSLDVQSYSQLNVIFSALMVIGMFSSMGQQTFIIKYVTLSREKGECKEGSVYIYSMLMSFLGSALGFFIFAFYCLTSGLSVEWLPLGGVFIFSFSLSQVTIGILRVNNKTLIALITRDLIWRFLTILTIVIISYYINLEAITAMWFLTFSLLFCEIFQLYLSYRFISIGDNFSEIRWKEWSPVSFSFLIILIISSSDLYIFTLVSNNLVSSLDLSAFFSSVKTVELVGVFLMAITLVISPKISTMVANKDKIGLQRMCNIAILIQAIPVIPISIIIIYFAPEILGIFGREFIEYKMLLQLLVVGMLINSLTGSTVFLLQVSGNHWYHVLFQGLSVIISASFLPTSISLWGANGIAVCFILSKIIWNVLAIIKIKETLEVNPTIYALFSRKYNPRDCLLEDLLRFKL
ncbi:lipopolysaccharide biosynthesis protein [Vibrio lentus]